VFRDQFPAAHTAFSPKFAPLDANRVKTLGGGVCTLTIPASVDRRDVPAAEADRIARFIRSEVDAGRRSFGDFLVLTRKRKNLGAYVEPLEAVQVPVEVSGAGAFVDSEEVAHLALLLRALSDPQDGVSLVGVLRGPFFGISDQDLFAFRQAGGWFSLFSGADSRNVRLPFAEAQDRQPDVSSSTPDVFNAATCVPSALTSLNQMFRWTRIRPAGAALERVLERTG
jgi:ATP-dependent helicase/nuclease subunit A